MTLSVAWIRMLRGGNEELIFASDSRLRGGYAWDTAQKIFPLPGINAVISFAGDSALALPVIDHILVACENYPQTRSGATDISEIRRHIINILNSMRDRFADAVPREVAEMDRQTVFLLGGYSHLQHGFLLSRISYDRSLGRFWHAPPRAWRHVSRWSRLPDWWRTRKYFCFAGDYYHEFQTALSRIISSGRGNIPSFDMEPLQALTALLHQQTVDMLSSTPTISPSSTRWRALRIELFAFAGAVFIAYRYGLFPRWRLNPQ